MQVLHWCVSGCLAMARLCLDAFPGARRWQNAREMRFPASDGDKVLARCAPERFAVARFRRGAFPGGNPWQVLRSMHPESGLGRENRQFAARFARHASEMSWLWQDMRAMHPKCPANRRLGIHRAKILPSAAEQRERSQPQRRPYGRRNGARAASCRAGWRCQRSAWCCGVSSAGGKAGISEAPLSSL